LLPRSITIAASFDITNTDIEGLMDNMGTFLADSELPKWRRRLEHFVQLHLFHDSDIESIADSDNPQPWIIRMLKDGGLDDMPGTPSDPNAQYGIVPCTTMPNHAVAFCHDAGRFKSWLVTSRKPRQGWNWDSDIGHECAHAKVGGVPLFSQGVNADARLAFFQEGCRPEGLSSSEWGRFAYCFCELTVVAARGERRATGTGLPAPETTRELRNFLRLAHGLMPHFGFDDALEEVRMDRTIDPDDPAMFLIGAAALRVMRHLTPMVSRGEPLNADWYRSLSR
jgi:hypothetical protein